MRYLVYKNGRGYFVGYKDKLNNEYSDNYKCAKKYYNIGSAISRLGLEIRFNSIEEFLELNCTSEQIVAFKRDIALNDILDKAYKDLSMIKFKDGYIEVIDEDGKIFDGTKTVIDYIASIPKNKTVKTEFVDKADMDFWNEYLS